MRNIKLLIFTILITASAFAAKISENELIIGKGSVSEDTSIYANQPGKPDPFQRFDSATQRWTASNDGINTFNLGSGGGGAGGLNLLAENNFDFESGLTGWVNTGGAAFTSVTTAPILGEQSATWDASVSGDLLESQFKDVPLGLSGKACQQSFDYTFNGTKGDLLVKVVDHLNNELISVEVEPFSSADKSAKFDFYFTCPTPTAGINQIKFVLESTADAALIVLDNVFLGRGQSIFTNLIGKPDFAFTVNNLVNPPVVTNSNDSQITCTRPVTGDVQCGISHKNLIGTPICTAVPVRSAPQALGVHFNNDLSSNTTLRLRGWQTGGNSANASINAIFNVTCQLATIDRGLQGVDSINLETVSEILDVRIGAGSALLSGNDTTQSLPTSFTLDEINDSRLILFKDSKDTVSSRIACASGEAASGSTCTSDEVVGVNFTASRSGVWKICTEFSVVGLGAGTAQEGFFQFNKVAPSTQNSMEFGVPNFVTELSNTSNVSFHQYVPYGNCGLYNITSGINEFKLFIRNNGSGQFISLHGDSYNNASIQITGYPISNQFPTPAFTDLRNSLSKRIESNVAGLKICSGFVEVLGGVPLSQDDDNCVSNVVDVAAGVSQVLFEPGTFSGRTRCVVSVQDDGNGDNANCFKGNAGTTLGVTKDMLPVNCEATTTGGNTDFDYDFICIGN